MNSRLVFKIYFCFIVFLIFSCNSDSNETLIAGKIYKLWMKVDAEENKRGVRTYYYFGKDGKFEYYRKYKNSDRIEKLDMGDVIPEETWRLVGNGKIEISGQIYNIKVLKDNSFVYSIKSPNFLHRVELLYNGDILTN